MDSAVSAHVQAIPSRSHSDNGPEVWCANNSSSSLLLLVLLKAYKKQQE